LSSVGLVEKNVGVKLEISSSGLKAVDTIQKTGKTRTAKTASPTAFHAHRANRRLVRRRAATGLASAASGARAAA
jgi:hypothetical protein